MDKKNTMLLTVIAVATLLVAVVGATFAYFSVTTIGDSSTTVVTAQSQQLPTVTMTSGKDTFGIAVTAEDMAINNSGPRWAMKTGDEGSNNASSGKDVADGLYYWSKTEIKHNLFSIKAENTSNENEDISYECPVTITLTAQQAVRELDEGDLMLYLYSKGGDVLVSELDSDSTETMIEGWENNSIDSYTLKTNSSSHESTTTCNDEKGCYDISDLFSETNEEKKLYTVVIVKASNEASDETSVEASMKLVNKADADQGDLAGKTIKVTLTSKIAEGGCKVVTKNAA